MAGEGVGSPFDHCGGRHIGPGRGVRDLVVSDALSELDEGVACRCALRRVDRAGRVPGACGVAECLS